MFIYSKNWISVLIILTISTMILYISNSYAYLKTEIDTGKRVDVKVGILSYNLDIEGTDENTITIEKNSSKEINIELINNSPIGSKYKLYYEFIDNEYNNNLIVQESYKNESPIYGILNKGKNNQVRLNVINNDDSDIKIKFGIAAGLEKNDIELNSNQYEINKNIYLIDYSSSNLYAEYKNGAKIVYDNTNELYAINLDGINDYIEVPTINSEINFEDGFTINYSAYFNDLTKASTLLRFNELESGWFDLSYSQEKKVVFSFESDGNIYDIDSNEEILNSGKNDIKIEMKKNDDNEKMLNLYINKRLANTIVLDDDVIIKNISRKNNYIGKGIESNSYFNGIIYQLNIRADNGEYILNYDLTNQYEITNIFTNGSFEDGDSTWILNNSELSTEYKKYGTTSVKNSNEGITIAAQYDTLNSNNYVKANHKYYVAAYLYKVSGNSCYAQVGSNYDYDNHYKNIGTVTENEIWQKVSTIYKEEEISNGRFSFTIPNSDDEDKECYGDGITIIDLTESFGYGNEPSLDWCNRNINYFDGTITILKN